MAAEHRRWFETTPNMLILRSEPGARRTAAAAAALGFQPILSPFLRIVRCGGLSESDFDGIQALAFTSGAAVAAAAADFPQGAGARMRALPAYCVGDATAALAREAGFAHVVSAMGDAAALREKLRELAAQNGAVLHLRGAQLAARLSHPEGPQVVERTLYDARRLEQLPPEAAAALAAPTVVLIHSRRIAEAFAYLLESEMAKNAHVFAISARAAEPLSAPPCASVSIARQPNDAALLERVAAWIEKNAASN